MDAAWSEPALIVLVGVSGAGKSTWAAERYARPEVVAIDTLRGLVGAGESDQTASADAFALAEMIVTARLGRRLTTVIDGTGLETVRRRRWRELARRAGMPAVVVRFDTPERLARQRNAARDRQVPARVITDQLRRHAAVVAEIGAEDWDEVLTVHAGARPPAPVHSAPKRTGPIAPPADRRLSFVLQVSRFEGTDADPAGWWRAMTEAAAAAGFDGIAVMDHLIQIPQVGRAWESLPEAWVTLGLLAGLDRGLRLGPLVSPVGFRPPGVTAKAAATLDVLTGGRAFLGVGAGWWGREYAGFGLPFPADRDRLDALESAIETIRALWAPGTKPYAGRHVNLPETTCYPRPIGPLPIIVGGAGVRRTLRIAARWGDACNVSSRPEILDRSIAALHAHCAELGRDPAEVAITVLDVTAVGRDRDEVLTLVERLHGRAAAAGWAPRHQVGTVSDQIRRYETLAERGVSTVFLALPQLRGPDDLATVAPVVAAFG